MSHNLPETRRQPAAASKCSLRIFINKMVLARPMLARSLFKLALS